MKRLILLFNLTITFVCTAQTLDDVAQNFGSHPGFIGYSISAMAVQTDGKVVLGGDFDSYNGLTDKNITRLNTDGSKDTNFNTGSGFSSTVNSIVIQTDGKILVGGVFTEYNENFKNRIIRLNTDGSNDTSFNIGYGFQGIVNIIALQSDGKILVGGSFESYEGNLGRGLVRLNADGSRDTSFNSGSGFINNDSQGKIYSISVQSDGKILVGGNFNEYNGSPENKIIRLNADGSIDTSFNTGSGFNNIVRSISTQNDGKILVGGYFTEYNGLTENNIIRLDADGSKDATFNTGVGFNDTVNTISVQNDGKILVGGEFTEYSAMTESKIIRLNTDGSKDINFTTGTGFNPVGYACDIKSVVLKNDGKILAGGTFSEYNGSPRKHLIQLNTDGIRDTGFNTGNGFNGSVVSTFEQSDGKILVGGNFIEYRGLTENGIIRLNADGSKDTNFNTGTGFNVNNAPTASNTSSVRFITVQGDGKILIGGNFTEYNGLPVNKIVRLNADGSKDTSFDTGLGFNEPNYVKINTIKVQPDGKILAGGNFSEFNGMNENRIIRLNVDGSKDTSFITGSGFNGSEINIALQNDGKILVGGYFTEYNGIAESHIIRLNADGSKDTSFNTGTGFNTTVHSIKIQSDGKILVGGYFTQYNGVTENRIIRLNTDGSKDSSFNTGTGFNSTIYSITIQADGKILVVGSFTDYNGILGLIDMIRLNTDGSMDNSFTVGTGFSGSIGSVTEQSNGNILVGGGFLRYLDGNDSSHLIALNATSTLSNDTFNRTESFSFWPNPTNNVIHLSFPENNYSTDYTYTLLNMNGEVLQQDKITDLETEISLAKLACGVYLIKLKLSNTDVTKRIIKQ